MSYSNRIILLLVALLCSSSLISAQKIDKDHISIAANGRWNHVLPISMTDKVISSYDYASPVVNIGFSTYQKDHDWFERAFNYPTFGISFGYMPMGSLQFTGKSRLGDLWDLYGWAQFYLLQTRRFRIGPSLSLGKAYTPVIYHWKDNPDNIFIGSHWQNIVGFGVKAEFLISRHLAAELTFDLQHHSNGMVKAPNWGINEMVTGLGLRYYLAPTEFPARGPKLEKPDFKKGLGWRIFTAFGVHSCQQELDASLEIGKEENLAPAHPIFELGTELVWRYSPIFATGILLEGNYTGDNNREIDRILLSREDPAGYSHFRVGIALTQEFWYKRVSIHLAGGIYVFKKTGLYEDVGRTIIKLGMRYHSKYVKGLFAGIDLRTHYLNRSYSIEWCLGYSL